MSVRYADCKPEISRDSKLKIWQVIADLLGKGVKTFAEVTEEHWGKLAMLHPETIPEEVLWQHPELSKNKKSFVLRDEVTIMPAKLGSNPLCAFNRQEEALCPLYQFGFREDKVTKVCREESSLRNPL